MGRYVGVSHNRGKGGGGGSGDIIVTTAYDRSVGLSSYAAASNNKVASVTLGDNAYTSIMYNSVGLITGFNEKVGDDVTGWVLTYDSNNLCDTIVERSDEHPPLQQFTITTDVSSVDENGSFTTTVSTVNVNDNTTLYWELSGTGIDANDFASGALTGSGTIASNQFTFSHTLAEDNAVEGAETINIKVYIDSGRTSQVGETHTLTINDTSAQVQLGTQTNPAANAKEIYDSTGANNRTNGFYWIKGNGTVASARQFYCILDDQWGGGGGWLVIANHDAQKYANTSGSNHQPRPTAYASDVGCDGNNSGYNPTDTDMRPEISFSCDMSDIPYEKVMHAAYDNSGMSSISSGNWLGLPHIYWCSSFSTVQTMPTNRAWSQQFNTYGIQLNWNGSALARRHYYSDYDCQGWGVWNPNSGPNAGQSPYRNGSNNSSQYDPCYCATWNYNTSNTTETTSWHDTGNYGYDDWQDGSGQGDGWYVENTGSKQNARDKPSFLLVQ